MTNTSGNNHFQYKHKTALQIYTSKQPCRCLHPRATFYMCCVVKMNKFVLCKTCLPNILKQYFNWSFWNIWKFEFLVEREKRSRYISSQSLSRKSFEKFVPKPEKRVFSGPFLEIKLELVAYHAWNLYQFVLEFYPYNSMQNHKFIFYICLFHCIWLVVWDDIWQFRFCLLIFDGIWWKFSASFLALECAN